jgi:hypothetical protein
MSKMKNKFIFLILGTLLVSFLLLSFVTSATSGKTDLNPIKRGECISLYQSCANCNYVNLTDVIFPNGTIAHYNINMDKTYTSYTYNFCSTNELGLYTYSVKGDPNGIVDVNSFSFEVTSSGQSGVANIAFFLFVIVLLYAITFIGFFGKNIPLTILGGMALLFLGIYLIQHGIIIFQDNLTNYIGYVTIATGFITAMWAALEQFEVI